MKLDYTFKNPELLKNALTHSSYANEHRDKGVKNNERLEFLGDSVLGLICTKYIWNHYKNMPEGELTKLRSAIVCEGSLYEFALKIGLGDDLLLGKGEKSSGGGKRPSVLSDACEAVIAAVYLGPAQLQWVGSAVAALRLNCPEARGIFPNQGSNLCPLHWQVDS